MNFIQSPWTEQSEGIDQIQSHSLTVSVIIPTKNRSADLARTIETLLQQTVQPLELIIVDQSAEPSFIEKINIPTVCIHDPTLIWSNRGAKYFHESCTRRYLVVP